MGRDVQGGSCRAVCTSVEYRVSCEGLHSLEPRDVMKVPVMFGSVRIAVES